MTLDFSCSGTFDFPKELYEVTHNAALFRSLFFVENNYYGMPQNAPYPAAEQRDFEPDTPIEAPTGEPAPEKKRRPKFVDFFMKKNSDKK